MRCRRHNGPKYNYKGAKSSGSWSTAQGWQDIRSTAPGWQDQGWKYHGSVWTKPQKWAEWDEDAESDH
eukprot:16054733-Heterocapsa_arctica.AAC.1